jgi:phenylacetate-coenzyme A ligase PaaK-like adenylate-forming protein
LAEVFQCAVRDHYGASEFFSIATECALGHLHANTDWLVLEPVDAQVRPVPPVCGRNDPPLQLRAANGELVVIAPLALVTVLEEESHLFDFQWRQIDARTLELAVPTKGEPARAVLQQASAALQRNFERQGLASVHIRTRNGAKMPRGASGKVARVLSN